MELKDIKSPADIKGLDIPALETIASEMRQAILGRTSAIGGHVGPNLGAVEPILALHYVFDAPEDRLVFDVSHQDFVHKMLTGRVNAFINPEDYDNVGEYTDPSESPEYDLFYAGHTSPSITLCTGLAKARQLSGDRYNIVAFIGDGSLSGGVAFEGLDAAAALGGNFIVIVNDNQMAIAEDHGGLYRTLARLRETNGTAGDNIFKALGFDYVYVADGNNLEALIDAYRSVRDSDRPVVVHLNTQKGLGYPPAERDREYWHWQMPYIIDDGMPRHQSDTVGYDDVIRDWLLERCKDTPELLIISSATPESFSFMAAEREQAGKHYMDVAIAEQAGVSVMAGAARDGAKVVYPVVASFLQRAYDQLVEDWAMNPSPALMLVLSSGLCGITDMTHLGFWDIPMITSVPDIVYLAPTSVEEMTAMMNWGLSQDKHKVAIRIPTYSIRHDSGEIDTDYSRLDTFKVTRHGTRVVIIAAGDFYEKGAAVADLLEQVNIHPTLINPRYLSGVDLPLLKSLSTDHDMIVTIEDGSLDGGFGQRVAAAVGTLPYRVKCYGLAKKFVDRYTPSTYEQENRLNPVQIASDIIGML